MIKVNSKWSNSFRVNLAKTDTLLMIHFLSLVKFWKKYQYRCQYKCLWNSKNNDKFMTNEVLSNSQDEEVPGSSKNENIKEDIYDSNQHKNKNEEMLGSTDEEEIVIENVGYRTCVNGCVMTQIY